MNKFSKRRVVIMLSLWLVIFYGAYQLMFAKSKLASTLQDNYAYKRDWEMNTINSLVLDSAYGAFNRLNPYEQGEKRVYYYFPSVDITFEVSGVAAVNPNQIVGVIDGKKEL